MIQSGANMNQQTNSQDQVGAQSSTAVNELANQSNVAGNAGNVAAGNNNVAANQVQPVDQATEATAAGIILI